MLLRVRGKDWKNDGTLEMRGKMHHSTTTEGEDLPRSDYSNLGIERNHSPSNSDWLLGNQPLPLFYNFQPLLILR